MCVYVREDSYTPVNIIEAIYGLALCFFGGLYPLTIAAGETFRVSGGDRVKKCFLLLWDDLKAVHQVPDIRLCCRYMAYSCVLLFDMGLAVLCAFPAQLTRRCSRSPACEPAKSARARSWASARDRGAVWRSACGSVLPRASAAWAREGRSITGV